LGRLFEEGIYRHDRIIALTGSEVVNPGYYRIRSGSSVREMVTGNVKTGNLRYISGNVLTGTRIEPDGYLGYYDSQVSVIPEGIILSSSAGQSREWTGSVFYRTFLSSFFPRGSYTPDTNLNGGSGLLY